MNLNKIKIAALGILAAGATACSESFLEVESKTESTTANFYQSESDAYRALIGCYDGWQCTVSAGPTFTFQHTSMLMDDDCYGALGTGDKRDAQVIDRFDIGQDASQVNLFNKLWELYYKAIFRCNSFITNMGNDTTETVKNYVSQAKAIRAFCYFDLARLFENVPLVLEVTEDNVPQASPSDTYAQIVKDLNEAIEGISDAQNQNAGKAEYDGWISKYAAEAVLARVYLFYSGVYGSDPTGCTKAQALAAVEDVIASQQFALVENYKDLWPAAAAEEYDGKSADFSPYEQTTYQRGNKECVLTLKFNYTADYNGNQDGNRTICMVSMGRTTDALMYPYGGGWGSCTVNPKLLNEYAANDSRKTASIIDCKAEGVEDSEKFAKNLKVQREYTGYFNKKFHALAGYKEGELVSLKGLKNIGGDDQISQFQDYVIVRYADVLLMAAELGSANAADYFGQVHERATGDKGTYSEDNLKKERHLEFAFEGIRYWDLLRWGLNDAANTIAASSCTTKSGDQDDIITITAANIISKKGFMQIPLTQIQLSNGVLKQNQGW